MDENHRNTSAISDDTVLTGFIRVLIVLILIICGAFVAMVTGYALNRFFDSPKAATPLYFAHSPVMSDSQDFVR